jgi:hypothetical protein
MTKIISAVLIVFTFSVSGFSQSKVMKNLSESYDNATTLMFYYSTLKMLIPDDKPELKELIYDVEKIKLLMVDSLYRGEEIGEIRDGLEEEGYDEAMSIRHEDNNIIVYIKEKGGTTSGFFFLMEKDNGLTALDLVGKVPMDKLDLLTKNLDLLTDARNLPFN